MIIWLPISLWEFSLFGGQSPVGKEKIILYPSELLAETSNKRQINERKTNKNVTCLSLGIYGRHPGRNEPGLERGFKYHLQLNTK